MCVGDLLFYLLFGGLYIALFSLSLAYQLHKSFQSECDGRRHDGLAIHSTLAWLLWFCRSLWYQSKSCFSFSNLKAETQLLDGQDRMPIGSAVGSAGCHAWIVSCCWYPAVRNTARNLGRLRYNHSHSLTSRENLSMCFGVCFWQSTDCPDANHNWLNKWTRDLHHM